MIPRSASLLLASLTFSAAALAQPADVWCSMIGNRLASVSVNECQRAGLRAAEIRSTKGRALMLVDRPARVRKVAANAGALPRSPRIMVIGGIHGDELTSVSIVFRWMQWLDQPEAQNYHWRVIPLANPDGLLSSPPQRMNANGVDLNRNFPTPGWAEEAPQYWKTQTGKDPRRFPGKHALSESETVWLNDQIESFNPDVIFSVHAPYGVLDYDGPARQPRRFGQLGLSRLGVYPGSLGNFGGIHKKLPVVTIELPNANTMPPLREQQAIWKDMLRWLRNNITPRPAS